MGDTESCLYRKMRKCCQSPRHLVEILLLIVLVAHVDLFEQSSSPPERKIKWPKTKHIMAKNEWKLSKVAITGSTRPLLAKNGRVGVGQSDTANNTLYRYGFQVHPFLAKKAPGTPVSVSSCCKSMDKIFLYLFVTYRRQ